jgi:hypothetical protein
MSSGLAAAPQGIPIPTEEIRTALESVAIPGFNGSVQMEIHFTADAEEILKQCIVVTVLRRQTKRVDEESGVTRQQLPDPTRKKPVEKVLADLKKVLFVQTVLKALDVQVVDGVLQKEAKLY